MECSLKVLKTGHFEHSENVLIIEWERLGYLVCVCCVGRAMQLRPTLIEDFKTLVAEQGMSKDTIVLKKNKGTLTTQTNAQPRFYSDQMIIFGSVFRWMCSRWAVHTRATDPGEDLGTHSRN